MDLTCDICRRAHHPQRLPFLCPVDARNRMYPGRLRSIHVLVENEGLKKQIGDLLSGNGAVSESLDKAKTQQRLAEDKTTQVLAAADQLKQDIRAARDEIRARKEALVKKRTEMTTLSEGLHDHRARRLRELQESTSRRQIAWDEKAGKMSETRSFLCREAAELYGLKRVTSAIHDHYDVYLGELPVVDLYNLNTYSADYITTSLAHISHVLMLTAHYLSMRLPAEITLPHRDYPKTTIYNLQSSYGHGDTTYPSTPDSTPNGSSHRISTSQHIPRPRPLYITKTLPVLAKEDPSTYSFFLEGVSLLAYNIAWLCGSQGISIGDKSNIEDALAMGENLYTLLIAQRGKSKDTTNSTAVNRPTAQVEPDSDFGYFSHGSARYYLGRYDGAERIKDIKLPSPTKLADKLRKQLLGDAPEWEVLEDDAWKVDPDAEPQKPLSRKEDSSKMGTANGKANRPEDYGGWMKVKSR